jgi:hypothetical protein
LRQYRNAERVARPNFVADCFFASVADGEIYRVFDFDSAAADSETHSPIAPALISETKPAVSALISVFD